MILFAGFDGLGILLRRLRKPLKGLHLSDCLVGSVMIAMLIILLAPRTYGPQLYSPRDAFAATMNKVSKALFLYAHEENQGILPDKGTWRRALVANQYAYPKQLEAPIANMYFSMNSGCEGVHHESLPPEKGLFFERDPDTGLAGGLGEVYVNPKYGRAYVVFANDRVREVSANEISELNW